MLMEKTLKIMKEEAYLQGWQDAADAVTSNFENALRKAIDDVALPNFDDFKDEDDNKEKSQG
jgi:hypothetical protein